MAFDPCNFSNEIDNPYLPLSKHIGKTLTYTGQTTDNGQTLDVEWRVKVLPNTTEIADVETLTVVAEEWIDGELAEVAVEYYAQGLDGTVYYFGEDSTTIENGQPVDEEGSWTVGDDAPVPAIAMPANPAIGIGFAFHSEAAPGVACQLNVVKSLNETVTVEQGTHKNGVVMDIFDFNDGAKEEQVYASGVGLIRESSEDEKVELVSIS